MWHVKIDEADAFYAHLTTFVKKECPGGIGILINNVGVGNEAPLNCEEVPIALEREMIRINCEGTCGMQRTLLPIMKAQEKQAHGRKGAIINISSASGTHPSPMLAVYSATKAFITQVTYPLFVMATWMLHVINNATSCF